MGRVIAKAVFDPAPKVCLTCKGSVSDLPRRRAKEGFYHLREKDCIMATKTRHKAPLITEEDREVIKSRMKLLNKLHEESGLTQNQVVKLSGVGLSSLHNALNAGAYRITDNVFNALLDVYNSQKAKKNGKNNLLEVKKSCTPTNAASLLEQLEQHIAELERENEDLRAQLAQGGGSNELKDLKKALAKLVLS